LQPVDFIEMFQSVTVLRLQLVAATTVAEECCTQLCDDWWCFGGRILHCWL